MNILALRIKYSVLIVLGSVVFISKAAFVQGEDVNLKTS